MPLKFQLDRFTLMLERFCGKGYSKTDRQTHTDVLSKTTFLDVWRLYIPDPVLSQTRFFARCQYFNWHGSKKKVPKQGAFFGEQLNYCLIINFKIMLASSKRFSKRLLDIDVLSLFFRILSLEKLLSNEALDTRMVTAIFKAMYITCLLYTSDAADE